MLAVCVLGMFSKLLANGKYRRLIRQSENMGTAKDKYLKQWKVKFENTYRSSSGIHNIPVYVERNLEQYRFMGMRLGSLSRLNRLAALFLCLGGAAVSFLAYWYGGSGRITAMYAVTGILLGGVMILWESICDTPGKAETLLLQIRDYFENTLVKRLETGQAVDLMPAAEAAVTGSGISGPDHAEAEASLTAEAEIQEQSPSGGGRVRKREHADLPEAVDGQRADLLRKSEEAAGKEQDAALLRKRLERIASGRRTGGQGRKLTAEEEHLIEDIIQEYLYE